MNRQAYVALLLTTLFWGGNAVAGKFAVGHISPMMLTVLRWGIALVFLGIIGRRQLAAEWPALRRNWLLLFVLGAVGFTAFNVALYVALVFTSAVNVSVEQAGIPVVIFLLNFLIFRIKVGWGQIAGFVVTAAGVGIAVSRGEPFRLLSLDVNFGDLLMLAGCVVYAAYTLALRYKPAISWQSTIVALTAAAFVSSLPCLWVEARIGGTIVPDARGWLIVAYVVVFPTILSQVLFIRGVELIGANRAGLFINLVPVFGTLLSVLLLGEDFHLYHAIAMALALGGIWLAEASGRRTT